MNRQVNVFPTNIYSLGYLIFIVDDDFVKIFSHDTAGGVFPTVEAASSMNPDKPEAALFSVLDKVEQFRDNSNLLHFKLCYPLLQNLPGLEASSPCNEWVQSSNPARAATISGFQAISLAFPNNGHGEAWAGLGRSAGARTLVEDTPTEEGAGWMALGATQYNYPQSRTIPGPWLRDITKVELYIHAGAIVNPYNFP